MWSLARTDGVRKNCCPPFVNYSFFVVVLQKDPRVVVDMKPMFVSVRVTSSRLSGPILRTLHQIEGFSMGLCNSKGLGTFLFLFFFVLQSLGEAIYDIQKTFGF